MSYVDYIMETTEKLLAIPSPSGFTAEAAKFVSDEFSKITFSLIISPP